MDRSENIGKRCGARSPHARWATAVFGATLVAATALLAVGCADEAERASEQTAVEPEPGARARPVKPRAQPEPGVRTVRVRPPSENPPSQDPPLAGQDFRLQKKRDWWNRAREVLFSGIEISEEQARAVDAIIEAQLNTRAQMQLLDAEIRAARKARDAQQVDAAQREFRALKKQLGRPHEIYEEMRAVLAEEQRSAFDMNRARHVAETQNSGRIRPGKRAERAEEG